MSQKRETIPRPLKFLNALIDFPAKKASDVLGSGMKAALAVCVVVSISLISYMAFSFQSRQLSCPNSDHAGLTNLVHQSEAEQPSAGVEIVQKKYLPGEGTNLSHVLFGIGGSAKTWHKRRHYCELWWRPNVTRGYVWLDDRPPANESWPQTSPPFRVSEDTSRFKYTSWYGSRSAVRIARIVKESFRLGLPSVRWFVMGDDDTVFFTDNLVSVLRKYDHRQMYYIGVNSESVDQDSVHSYGMAYGGGGMAISYPLAAVLVRVLDDCINRYHSLYGSDQKIHACMNEIGVPITREIGFHQLDIRGDSYGILSAHPVAPLVSLHHLDYLRPIFPTMDRTRSLKKLFHAYWADPGRTLQHSFCYDLKRNWTVYVAWGYNIQLYPWAENARSLEIPMQTFLTWTSNYKPFTFNTRPLTSDPCKRPLLFFLHRVDRSPTGRTDSTYDRFGKGRGGACQHRDYVPAEDVKAFHVSAPQMDPDYWETAPRRQCCDVIDGGDGHDRTVRVEMRRCEQRETVTPP